MKPEHPATPDVRGLYQLVHQLDVAIDKHDRDRALEVCHRLRELARHAYALIRNTQVAALASQGEGDGKDALAPLPSAATTSPPHWRPISTAPKDGTLILVYAPEREGLPSLTCPCAWHPDAGFCVDELREPSHWMPLPAHPREDDD